MDGTAAVGTSLLFSREDHRHPTDTSRAPLASPVFTGDPQAPTPATADNDTSIATTAFVKAQGYVTGGPYAPIASPTFTGTPTAPTPTVADFSTKLATTAFVNQSQIIGATIDLNTITAPGTYACSGGNNNPNEPTGAGQWYLHVLTYGPSTQYLVQVAYSLITDGLVYTRRLLAGTWQPWTRILDATAIATSAQYLANTANLILTTDKVWAAAAPVQIATAASLTPDFAFGIDFYVTLNQAGHTLNNPANMKSGQKGLIYLIQDATGNRTITTWGNLWKFPGGTKPVLSTAAGSYDILSYAYSGANLFTTFNAGFA
jgi:hypothetical protein